jgi:hypothetical protein
MVIMAYPTTVDFGASQSDILNWMRNGQCFTAMEKLTGSSVTGGLAIFNAANSSKTLILYRIYMIVATAATSIQISTQTTDYALGAATQAGVNKLVGGPAKVATVSGAASGLSQAGTQLMQTYNVGNTPYEVLMPNAPFVFPVGVAQALEFLAVTGTGNGAVHFEWAEI